ncbi:MAG: hypothetical protein KR126chlam3_00304, partial [Chlamydiae bacterium]|nr:hypothetical protein [Chlamydiota bacterium]
RKSYILIRKGRAKTPYLLYYKRNKHVFAQCQFSRIGGRSVGNDITSFYALTDFYNRTLV